MSPRTLCVANLKGGQAKTATAVTLAHLLASERERVLLVDLDPENSGATQYLLGGISPDAGEGLYAVLGGRGTLEDVAVQAQHVDGVHVVPAGPRIAEAANANLHAPAGGQLYLRNALARLAYDWVIFDCPPSTRHLLNCALAASDRVLVPCEAESAATKGVAHLTRLIMEMRALSPKLHIAGIVPTRVKLRRAVTHEQIDVMRRDYGAALFESYVRDDVAVTQSESHARPVTLYRRASNAAADYRDVFSELMSRVGGI